MDYTVQLLLLALTMVLVNNYVFFYFIGGCPYLGVTHRLDIAFGMGLAVTFCTTVSALLGWAAMFYLLRPGAELTVWICQLLKPDIKPAAVDLSILNYTVYIILIASSVQLVEMYLRKFNQPLYKALGIYLPLITTNCCVLFACLIVGSAKHLPGGTDVWYADKVLVYSVFAGLGFTLAMCLMGGVREELEHADVPKPFRGPATVLIVAGILAMAFMGFAGVDGGIQKLFGSH